MNKQRNTLCGVLIAALCLTAHSASASGLPSVYGFTLGAIPEIFPCGTYTDQQGQSHETPLNSTCFLRLERDDSTVLKENDQVTVSFASDERPLLSSTGTLNLLILDNKVERIAFSTGGVYDEDTVLPALVKKFGQPTLRHKDLVKNSKGQEFDAGIVEWRRPSYLVTYSPITTWLKHINTGDVQIETVKGSAYRRKEELRRASEQKRPF
jgi:hypothetical protein